MKSIFLIIIPVSPKISGEEKKEYEEKKIEFMNSALK